MVDSPKTADVRGFLGWCGGFFVPWVREMLTDTCEGVRWGDWVQERRVNVIYERLSWLC